MNKFIPAEAKDLHEAIRNVMAAFDKYGLKYAMSFEYKKDQNTHSVWHKHNVTPDDADAMFVAAYIYDMPADGIRSILLLMQDAMMEQNTGHKSACGTKLPDLFTSMLHLPVAWNEVLPAEKKAERLGTISELFKREGLDPKRALPELVSHVNEYSKWLQSAGKISEAASTQDFAQFLVRILEEFLSADSSTLRGESGRSAAVKEAFYKIFEERIAGHDQPYTPDKRRELCEKVCDEFGLDLEKDIPELIGQAFEHAEYLRSMKGTPVAKPGDKPYDEAEAYERVFIEFLQDILRDIPTSVKE